MLLPVRGLALTLCVAAALAACPRAACAQGADTLPSLDESTPITAPDAPSSAPPPAPLVLRNPSQKPARALGPIRAQRRLALTGELGWNGLAGFGPILTYHLDPHLSFDMGTGLSLLGWKVGLRARYNLLTGPVTPFIGLGIIGAGGLGDSSLPINQDEPNRTRPIVNIKVLPSAWLQTVAGLDWTSSRGVTLVGALGYAARLSHDPVQVVTGTPNSEDELAFDVLWRSNAVLSLALGYSFH